MMNLFSSLMADPMPVLQALRGMGPVLRFGGTGPWIAVSHAACETILRDHGTFSSTALGGFTPEGARRDFGLTMIGVDPPDHTRLRGLVSAAFTPRRIAALTPRIAALSEELLDEATQDGSFELMTAFAEPLPVTIIAEMLGVPAADRAKFKRWSSAVVGQVGAAEGTGTREDRATLMQELAAYLREQLARRRAEPTDDLIGALVAAELEGDRLSPDEALATCILLLVAGNETTTNLIGNAVVTLTDHPAELATVAAEPGLLPGVLEETLRYAPPVLLLPRRVMRDTTLGGEQIAAGSIVLAVLGAANRDAAVFSEPDRFDPRRTNNRHLSFGHGIHYCLGAPLARLEARIGLEALLRRCPNLQRAGAGPVTRIRSGLLNGPQQLHVTWAA